VREETRSELYGPPGGGGGGEVMGFGGGMGGGVMGFGGGMGGQEGELRVKISVVALPPNKTPTKCRHANFAIF
jgi:hypothetical protein